MLKRVLAASSAGAIAFAFACSSNLPSEDGGGAAVVQSSSVSVRSFASDGTAMASCSGTLLGPTLVLTAGHCAAGAHRFEIAGADGTASAGTRAVTTNWKDFRSALSRKGHTDVALIELATGIKRNAYPKVTDAAAEGTLHRIDRNADGTFKSTDVVLSAGASQGFPHDYIGGASDSRDTGGAVFDSAGNIHGVVSGLGADSKLLHVARVDVFSKWLGVAQTQCVPSDTSSSSSSGAVIRSGQLTVKGYGTSSGTASSSGTSCGLWGCSSSSGSNTSSGWGGSNGGYGGHGGTIDTDGGQSSGTTTSSTSSSSGASSSSSSSGSTSSSSSGGTNTTGDGCVPPPSDNGGSTGSSTSSSSGANGGSSGLPGSSSSSSGSGTTSSGGSSGNKPSTSTGQGSGPGGEDDMDECGGCDLGPSCIDNVMDYGDSLSGGGKSVGTGGPVIK